MKSDIHFLTKVAVAVAVLLSAEKAQAVPVLAGDAKLTVTLSMTSGTLTSELGGGPSASAFSSLTDPGVFDFVQPYDGFANAFSSGPSGTARGGAHLDQLEQTTSASAKVKPSHAPGSYAVGQAVSGQYFNLIGFSPGASLLLDVFRDWNITYSQANSFTFANGQVFMGYQLHFEGPNQLIQQFDFQEVVNLNQYFGPADFSGGATGTLPQQSILIPDGATILFLYTDVYVQTTALDFSPVPDSGSSIPIFGVALASLGVCLRRVKRPSLA